MIGREGDVAMLITLFLRDLLSVTFLVSGVAKLLTPRAFEASLVRLGVGRAPLARQGLLWALPTLEVAVGSALLWNHTARLGAVLALVMLCVFTGAIALKLIRGEAMDCGCFGGLLSAPSGLSAVLRNLILTGAATSAAVGGLIDIGGWQRVFLVLVAASTVIVYLLIANLILAMRPGPAPAERGVSM